MAQTIPSCVAHGGYLTQRHYAAVPETPAEPRAPRVVEQSAAALPLQVPPHPTVVLRCPLWQLLPFAADAGPTAVLPVVHAPVAAGPVVLDSRVDIWEFAPEDIIGYERICKDIIGYERICKDIF